MKRSGPPSRKVRLKRGNPLPRGRLNPTSAKRRAEQKQRRDLAAPLQGERCRLQLPGCTGQAEHWHELVGAAHGGSRVDPRNICPACDMCNSQLEARPDRFELGLKVHSWDAVPRGWQGGLIPAVPSPYALASRGAVHDEGEVA